MNREPWGVIFDFGGVLSQTAGSREYLARAASALGVEVELLVRQLFAGEVWEQATRGEVPPAAYWAQVTAGIPTREVRRALAPFAENPFFRETLDPEVVCLIHDVKAAGHRLALCSNALPGLLSQLSQELTLYLAFDVVVISALAGSRKPEEAIYKHTLARLGLPAGRCVFIDDQERNLTTAARLGMHTLLFTTPGEVRAELQSLGVLPFTEGEPAPG